MKQQNINGIKYLQYYSSPGVEIFDLEHSIPKIEANEIKSSLIEVLKESHPVDNNSSYRIKHYVLFMTELFFQFNKLNQFLEPGPIKSSFMTNYSTREYRLHFVDKNYTSHFSFDYKVTGNIDVDRFCSINNTFNNFSKEKKCCYASIEYIREKLTPLYFDFIDKQTKISKDYFVYNSLGGHHYLLPIEQLIIEKIKDKTIDPNDGYYFKADYHNQSKSILVLVTCIIKRRKCIYYEHEFLLDLNNFELVLKKTEINYD